MHKTRILIVEDSAVKRHLISEALSSDPGLKVVGTAANGKLALDMLSQVRPEIVLLDVEMPEMDGLQTLTAIRAYDPSIRTIMLSRLTRRGSAAAVDALLRGADDYVSLPENTDCPATMVTLLQNSLLPKLKELIQRPNQDLSGNVGPARTRSVHKRRILIVNDSAVICRLLAVALSADPGLEVVGTAAHGRLAMEIVKQERPDVVLMDVEMPEMDGLQTLIAIRVHDSSIRVIMLNRFTQRGASVTIDALLCGAADYVSLSENTNSPAAMMTFLQEELVPQIKALCLEGPGTRRVRNSNTSQVRPPITVRTNAPRVPVEVIAIGVSTGGPQALSQLMTSFPADWSIPIVIVQHMPPMFTNLLAKQLAKPAAIGISEAVEGDFLQPGHALIAPGDFHMELVRESKQVQVQLSQGVRRNSCRPSVDVLFRSVAATYGAGTLAVVLTGMGQDGFQGCEAIRAAGGQVLVQDEASSVVWGMAGCVAKAGLADQVLPLDQIGAEIVRTVRQSRSATNASRDSHPGMPRHTKRLVASCEAGS